MDARDYQSSRAGASSTSGPSVLGNASDVIIGAPSTFNNATSIHNHQHVYQILEELRIGPRVPSVPEPRREHPSQTYARLMELKGRGLALWDPEPPSGLPPEYKNEGASIGDVGIVHPDGFFDFLFNICRPSDDPINGGRVPEGFVPLGRSPESRDYQMTTMISAPGSYEATGDISVLHTDPDIGDYTFQCHNSGEGAALVLPRGASKLDLLATAEFRRYASKNAVHWYEFAHGRLGREAPNGSIYLVTGSDKANVWGTSCFQRVNSQFDLTFGDLAWRRVGLASSKAGPIDPDGPYKNQAVFLRGFTVTLGETVWDKLLGYVRVQPGISSSVYRAHAHNSPFDQYGGRSWMVSALFQVMGRWSKRPGNPPDLLQELRTHETTDDVNVISSYDAFSAYMSPSRLLNILLLLEFPDSDVALSHDNSWCDLLKISARASSTIDLPRKLEDAFSILIEDGAISIQSYRRSSPKIPNFDLPKIDRTRSAGLSKPDSDEKTKFKAWSQTKDDLSGSQELSKAPLKSILKRPKSPIHGYDQKPNFLPATAAFDPPVKIHAVLSQMVEYTAQINLSLPVHAQFASSFNSRVIPLESAMEPPSPYMIIRCEDLPWAISITPTGQSNQGLYVTVQDVLEQIYSQLRTPASETEYNGVETVEEKREVAKAFYQRFRRLPGFQAQELERSKGLKRIDFLKGKNMFKGFSLEESASGLLWWLHVSAS